MQRRNFLKTAVGAAAVGANVGRVFGQDAPSERVRVAIMGCHAKGRGNQLMKTLMGLTGVEVGTVCDVDSRAMDSAADIVLQKTNKTPKKEKDLRRVLEDKDIDAVICAAPDHWHAPAALMTMQAGKAIFVEKPCSYNAGEGEMLVAAANKYGSVFQMGNQRRSAAIYHTVIKEIHDGLIGEARFARCWYASRRGPIGKGAIVPVPEWLDWDLWQGAAPRRPFQDNVVHYKWHWFHHWGTGECGNNATHYVDVARWALGVTFPSKVTSGGGRLFYEGDDWEWPDTQLATFDFPERKCITWEGLSSVNARPYENAATGCMIYGLKGAVLITPYGDPIQFDNSGKEVRKWTSKDVIGDAMNRTDPTGGLDKRHIGNWVNCIRAKDVQTNSPVKEAHASVLLTHLANIALRSGETVKIDSATGHLAQGSAGKEYWNREYEKGWEMKL